MTKSKVFQSLPCLTEISPHLYGKDLIKSWFKGGDKRHIEKLFYDFIMLIQTFSATDEEIKSFVCQKRDMHD